MPFIWRGGGHLFCEFILDMHKCMANRPFWTPSWIYKNAKWSCQQSISQILNVHDLLDIQIRRNLHYLVGYFCKVQLLAKSELLVQTYSNHSTGTVRVNMCNAHDTWHNNSILLVHRLLGWPSITPTSVKCSSTLVMKNKIYIWRR